MSAKLKPGTELHLHLLSVQSLIDQIGLDKEQGFKKRLDLSRLLSVSIAITLSY